MRRVLVLSDNPSFALAAMRTLGRGGHSCLLGSSAPARHPARSRYCAGYLSLPRLGVPGAAADAALARRLGDWARARGAPVVLPLTPPETTLVAAPPAAFAGMAVPPLPSAEALDKRRFWETCEAMGI